MEVMVIQNIFLVCMRISGVRQDVINVIKISLLLITKWVIVLKHNILNAIISNS